MSFFSKKVRLHLLAKILIVTSAFGIGSYVMIPNTTVVAYADTTDTTSNKEFIKNKILTGLQSYATEIKFTPYEMAYFGISNDADTNPADIYYEVLFEHPEIFWTSLKVAWLNDDDGYYTLFINNIYENSDIDSKKIELENKINEIISKISSYDDLRKVYEIHDYISENCTYDHDNASEDLLPKTKLDPKIDFEKYIADDRAIAKANANYFEGHSIYGVLINEKAVCEGYAKCAKILLNRSGIESEVIRSDKHGWNYVKVNGNYFQMDITFDDYYDERTVSPYAYFNITNSQIAQDTENKNTYTAVSGNVPNCTDNTFDNIFRTVKDGTIKLKNVVRVADKLYGSESIGNSHNLYSCNLDGTDKTIIKSDIYEADNVYEYNNDIYYYEYGLRNNKLYMDINKYDISTGEFTRFIDFLSEFGQPEGSFYLYFYIKDNVMYVTLEDDNGKTTKTYSVPS